MEGGEGPLLLPLPLLFYCDVSVSPPSTHHPPPIVVWMWFYFLSVSPPLFPLSNRSAPASPPPVVSCSFLGFCTTQLVYTVYTQPAKRKPDGKHLMVRLEWLCPAASGRRAEGPDPRAEGPERECGFSGAPGGGSAGHHVSAMSRCVTKSPTPKFSDLKQEASLYGF